MSLPSQDILLSAIAEIESGNNPKAVGKMGEVSEYQVLPAVWAFYGGTSVHVSQDRKRVAGLILNKLVSEYRSTYGKDPTVKQVYLLWNQPHVILSGRRPTQRGNEAACRFQNVVAAMQEQKTK